jgi:outer membrane translocation and assembly module TamA
MCWLMLSFGIFCDAQNSTLVISSVDKTDTFIKDTLKLKTQFVSRAQCFEYVRTLTSTLQAKGYLSASVDSMKQEDAIVKIKLFVGELYYWKQLFVDDKDRLLLGEAGIQPQVFDKQPYQPQQVSRLQEKLLDYFEVNGYPFAHLKFDSVHIDGREVSAKLVIQKGLLYRMDSIRLYGNVKINKSFLYHYLELPPKSIFDKSKMDKIDQRLLELPYIEQSQRWNTTMLGGSYLLNLYLKPKRSNQVDAIVGFLPANQQLGGKLLFTVDAKVKLQNAFATGESISLNWQQTQVQSPRLDISFQRPYIFDSKFGLDFSFELYKKDSSYININTALGVQYILSARQKGKIILQNYHTNLINVDTATIIATKLLPDISDVNITSLGIQYEWNSTNYKLNPTRGNEVTVSFAGGNKKIGRNSTITQIKDASFNYASLYDSIQLSTYQLNVRMSAAHYFPAGKYSVLKTAAAIGLLQSANYFRNEMFQIGGYRLLRGFDEESIITNRFAVASLEYRYLIGLNSYFFGFSDVGYSYNAIADIAHTYIGFGLGLAFETKQGIFNISIAEGKRNDLPFNFNESKVHLGFVSLF